MSDNSSSQRVAPGLSPQIIQSKIYQKNSKKTVLFFVFLLAIGIAFSAVSLFNDGIYQLPAFSFIRAGFIDCSRL